MDIWTDAIIPANPDAWIWAGDMIYVDNVDFDCHTRHDSVLCKYNRQQISKLLVPALKK